MKTLRLFLIIFLPAITVVLVLLSFDRFAIEGSILYDQDSFEKTKGEIIYNSFWENTDRSQRRGNQQPFGFSVVYQYQVDDVTYQSAKMDLLPTTFTYISKDEARNRVDQYPLGKEVTVYYLRNDPSIAVLEPGKKIDFSVFFRQWFLLPYLIFEVLCFSMLLSRRMRPGYMARKVTKKYREAE